jgi:uncharacterized Zn-finger protein
MLFRIMREGWRVAGNRQPGPLWCHRPGAIARIKASRPVGTVEHVGNREQMTDSVVPHFHNDIGVAVIEIGAKEFMCVGAKPPFDHPHIYCDMGDETEFICTYCSTLYRHDPKLKPNEARPAECALSSELV